MKRQIHQFDNGVLVFDDHLTVGQRERYLKHNLHEPVEEELFLKQIQNLPDDSVYLNIGCAIGYYLILAYKERPDLRFYAVEPLKRHRQCCQENLTLNGINLEKITMFPYAVSDIPGSSLFLEKDFGSQLIPGRVSKPKKSTETSLLAWLKPSHLRARLFGSSDNSGNDIPVITVETKTLDQIVHQISETIHFLQMDIQGLELAALRGGAVAIADSNIQKILIGTHGGAIHQDCEKLLRSFNYHISYSECEVPEQPDGMLLASLE